MSVKNDDFMVNFLHTALRRLQNRGKETCMKIQLSNWGTENTFKYEIRQDMYCHSLHIHQFAELILMLDGTMNVMVDNRTETIRGGQFALIFPFQLHGYISEQVNHLVIYTFSPNLISTFMKNAEGKTGERAVFDASPISQQIFTDYVTRERTYTDTSLYTVLACVYSMLADFTQQVRMIPNPTDSNVLSKLLLYMREHFQTDITLEEVARAIGYSANYLSRCIRSSLGLNYCRLLACIRIEHAKSLLTETSRSILEIALESGFGSERSFHRQFRNITGMTPGKYRSFRQLKVASYQCILAEAGSKARDTFPELPTESE